MREQRENIFVGESGRNTKWLFRVYRVARSYIYVKEIRVGGGGSEL